MNLNTFIQRVSYRLQGLDDDAPQAGTDAWNYWVDTLNMKKDELYADVTKQWSNTYQVLELGTVAAGTEVTFDLDETFLSAASTCYVIDLNGQRHDFQIVKPQEIDIYTQQVFIAGEDPELLYFSKEVKTDDQIVGGTLYLPAYVLPDDILPTQTTATINLPDPNWGVYTVAAEIAAGDLTYEAKEPNLTAKANNLYSLMTRNSRRGTYGNPRRSKTSVVRIGERRSNR